MIFRAISVPLAHRGERFGRVLAVLALLVLNVGVDGARDELVGAAGSCWEIIAARSLS